MSEFPQAFMERMKEKFGTEFGSFMAALDEPVTTSIRINPGKFDPDENTLLLDKKIPWTEYGYYLSTRPSFTFDPLFHAGAYYVQESSSMFLEQAFISTGLSDRPVRVLDLCAAPGGKSTHLLSLISPESLLVSNELTANRNHILRQNMARWGSGNVIVTQNKAEDFAKMGEFFDLIVIDAPCSGEGLFRKNKNAVGEWSEANVTMCAARQKDILSHIVKCLLPGGYLIYSTCTFEDAENLSNISYLAEEHGMGSMAVKNANNYLPELTVVSNGKAHGYAFYPHRTKGEGFFIGLLKKPGEENKAPNHSQTIRTAHDKHSDELLPHLHGYIDKAENYSVLKHQAYYNILPSIHLADYKRLAQNLYIRNAGISAGEIKGRDFIPAHELSLSTALRSDFPSHELDLKAAISYLRAETISIPTPHKGWMTVRYKGANLGFVKALPNRINNYFPKEWRILKAQS